MTTGLHGSSYIAYRPIAMFSTTVILSLFCEDPLDSSMVFKFIITYCNHVFPFYFDSIIT